LNDRPAVHDFTRKPHNLPDALAVARSTALTAQDVAKLFGGFIAALASQNELTEFGQVAMPVFADSGIDLSYDGPVTKALTWLSILQRPSLPRRLRSRLWRYL
jgi:hypothetical protein